MARSIRTRRPARYDTSVMRPDDRFVRAFFQRDTGAGARDLLGMTLVRDSPDGRTAGRIVEAEAYFGPGDPASHASRGPTPRSAIMFGHPGIAYVYFTYGMYHLLNVVTEDHGTAGAVLIRALQPTEGAEIMRCRHAAWRAARGRPRTRPLPDSQLANGPGKLTIAMAIDLHENGTDLAEGPLFIREGAPVEDAAVAVGPRVGVSAGMEEHLRFYVRSDPHVSKG